jgi:mannose-6-phosphate isomerase class I
VAHHSAAKEPAVVVLLRQQVLVERKNGHRKNLATGEEPRLSKKRFADLLAEAAPTYEAATAATIEAHALTVFPAKGMSETRQASVGGTLLYVLYGELAIETAQSSTRLMQGQLTIVPKEQSYTLQAGRGALVVRFE